MDHQTSGEVKERKKTAGLQLKMLQTWLEIAVPKDCACRNSGDVYGWEIKGEDYLKGQGILGKSLQAIR